MSVLLLGASVLICYHDHDDDDDELKYSVVFRDLTR